MKYAVRLITLLIALSFVFAGCKTELSQKEEIIKKDEPFKLSDFLSGGRPVFKKLKEARASFDRYLADLASFDVKTLNTANDKTAFWINTYNIFVIKILLDNYPDKKDIFQIEGFFDSKKLNVAGVDLSLNDISSTILRFEAQIKDPRINFALSNGTVSSPKLRKGGYNGANLDAELDESVRSFLKEGNNLIIDKNLTEIEKKEVYVVKVSQAFEWFKDEFKIKYGGLPQFLANYTSSENSKFLLANKDKIFLEYLPYNWNFANF